MIYVGSAGWNIPRAHKGHFPTEGSGLQRYAARLNAAEINTSFYRPHAPEIYARWAAAVPADFRFAVKMPKAISHDRALLRARQPLERFLDEIRGLGERLGVLLLQLPPSHQFEPRRAGRFFELLRDRYHGFVVCEPRHATWTSPAAAKLLLKFEAGRVAADPPRADGLAEPGGWPGIVYYRWHGSPRPYFSPYSSEQLAELAAKLRSAEHSERGTGTERARKPRASDAVGESAGRRSSASSVGIPSERRERGTGTERARQARASDGVGEFEGQSPSINIWCIFDNTGSGAAAANALELCGLTGADASRR